MSASDGLIVDYPSREHGGPHVPRKHELLAAILVVADRHEEAAAKLEETIVRAFLEGWNDGAEAAAPGP